jgi:multimeric flavodoxin WrbA
MKTNPKILFISGSPRKGNSEHVLMKIYESIKIDSKELILLKDKNIKFCKGCLTCYSRSGCIIKDDMEEIVPKILASDVLVLGTPNYYENVSALMKNFIDRCQQFYDHSLIRGKKVILVYVGGGGRKGTKKRLDLAFFWIYKTSEIGFCQ